MNEIETVKVALPYVVRTHGGSFSTHASKEAALTAAKKLIGSAVSTSIIYEAISLIEYVTPPIKVTPVSIE